MATNKTAFFDLTEKLLVSNFIEQPNLQIILEAKSMDESSWIFSIMSVFTLIFCSLSPFYREWPQSATILTSFDLSFVTKSKSLIFELKRAIHGGKDLTCKKWGKNWYKKVVFSRGSIHAFGLQIDSKILHPDKSSFSVKSQIAVLCCCHLTSFAKDIRHLFFSVKSLSEVYWIIMIQKAAVCICIEILYEKVWIFGLCICVFTRFSSVFGKLLWNSICLQ